MSRLIITACAREGLERCRRFLIGKNPHAAKRAGQAIADTLALLEKEPAIGRPLEDFEESLLVRELIISFGESGYVALYHYEIKTNLVYLLAFRHQKEAGYSKITDPILK